MNAKLKELAEITGRKASLYTISKVPMTGRVYIVTLTDFELRKRISEAFNAGATQMLATLKPPFDEPQTINPMP